MEKKENDQKFGSSTHQQAEDPNHFLNKNDQISSGAKRNTSGASSSHDNAQPSIHPFQLNFRSPHSTKLDIEQPALISKPSIPISLGQWQNWHVNQVQQTQPTPHSAQAALPFWVAQQPGYQYPGANASAAYCPFSPAGTTDVLWQGTETNNGYFPHGGQIQLPYYSYPMSYPYPAFPGPWNPSSWWVQQQQSVPSFTYTNQGACGYFSSPSVPACSAASAPCSQRGIIHPPAKLSHKHQQLWEAQSAENVQLWNVVGQLQSELATYKSRLTKLEADVALKPNLTEPVTAHGSEATSPGEKKKKRGRPKREIASNDVNLLAEQPLPRGRARGRKPKLQNVQTETTELNSEKYSQKKLVDESDIEVKLEGKTANAVTDLGDESRISICNQTTRQDTNRVHSFSQLKINNIKAGELKTNISITSHQVKGTETKNYATYGWMTNDGKFALPSNVSTSNCGKDLMNFGAQSCYNDFDYTGNARRLVGDGGFGNDDVSVHHANETTESGNNEDEQIGNGCGSSTDGTPSSESKFTSSI